MEKLDLKDRKILFHLMINSRQSFSQIGKKVGLHKDVVAYRVNNLIDRGIIRNFTTSIDTRALGFITVRYYLTLQFITPEVKKEIIDYFVKSPQVTTVLSADGDFDLVVVLCVSDIYDSFEFWEKTLLKYKDYFADQIFSVYLKQEIYYGSSILAGSDDLDDLKSEINPIFMGNKKKTQIDDVDKEIIKLLNEDSRIPTIEIAKKLKITSITINNRIKSLVNRGIIKIFTFNYQSSTSLGVNWYKVFIFLRDYKKTEKIIEYIKNKKHLAAIDKVLGYDDLELQFFFKNTSQLHQTMEDLSAKFSNAIK
jgi:Lrp/AsnC family leucine-responsive transcriptional regulator